MQAAIDEGAWQQFCGIFQGDQSAVKEILAVYLDESKELGQHLEAAAVAGDLDQVRRTAHSLKSTSKQVGAVPLGDVCGRLEQAAAAGDGTTVDVLLEQFHELLGASQQALQRRA